MQQVMYSMSGSFAEPEQIDPSGDPRNMHLRKASYIHEAGPTCVMFKNRISSLVDQVTFKWFEYFRS